MKMRSAFLPFVLTFLLMSIAVPQATAESVTAADAFARLKSLAGEWTGTVTQKGTGPATRVVYRVTAGGSTVEELLFPGTPHEMVTMYHLDGNQLVLTHYCAIGNQPHMRLAPTSTADHFVFEFASATNLATPDAVHMHSGTIQFVNADELEATWDVVEKGTVVGQNTFFLRRRP